MTAQSPRLLRAPPLTDGAGTDGDDAQEPKRSRHLLGGLGILAHVALVGLAWWFPRDEARPAGTILVLPPQAGVPVARPVGEDERKDHRPADADAPRHLRIFPPLDINGATLAPFPHPLMPPDDPIGPRDRLMGSSAGDRFERTRPPGPGVAPGTVAGLGPDGMGAWCPEGEVYR